MRVTGPNLGLKGKRGALTAGQPNNLQVYPRDLGRELVL